MTIKESFTKFYIINTHKAGQIHLGLQVKKSYNLDDNGAVSYFEMDMKPFVLQAPYKLNHLYKTRHDVWTLQLSLNGFSTYRPFCSSIYLHGDLQGLGIGTLLMNLMISEGKILFKDHPIAIELARGTNSKEEQLKRFYERFGFTIKKENEIYKGYADSFQSLCLVDEVEGIQEEEGIDLISSQYKREREYLWQKDKDKSIIEHLKDTIAFYTELSDKYYINLKRCIVFGTLGVFLIYVLH